MASTRNAFDLLSGGGEAVENVVSAAAAAKKRKSKKKGGQTAAPDVLQPVAAAPIAVPQIAKSAEPEPQRLQTAKEAGAALEAAAIAAAVGERGALALEWADQVQRSDAVFADGSTLADFRQVLLKSRAVELLLEGCLTRGAAPGEAAPLAHLLVAVAQPSVPHTFCSALAEATVGLGAVTAADPLAPTPAAKRSAAAALALVLRGIPKPPLTKPVEAPAARLKRLGAELGRQEARLPGTTQPKELAKVYDSILDTLCSQLDVLRPSDASGGPAHAPEVAAALKPLEELRSALSARLQEVQAPPKPALSVEEQLRQAEAAHRKEDAATTGRLAEVEGRIASLEAELAALKGEAGDLRQRLSSTQQLHARRLDQIRSGKAQTGATPKEIAAAVQGGLGAAEGLAAALRAGAGGEGASAGAATPAAGSATSLGAAVAAAEVPVKLLGAMQQLVELNMGQLSELGGKARFYRERLDKAKKQGEQAAKLGLGDPKAFAQQRATAEKNVKEVLAAAESAAASCRTAVMAYRERLPLMLNLPSFLPPPPDFLAAMEARAAEAEQLLEAITAGTYVPPVAVAAPAPAVAAPVVAPVEHLPSGGAPAAVPGDLAALERRLAELEDQSSQVDMQISAMLGSTTLEVPSPLSGVGGRTSMPPAMLSSPTSNKPVGLAAPIGAAAAPGAPISWSQALAAAPPAQANDGAKKTGRPRRA